jgi:hypothetical protein
MHGSAEEPIEASLGVQRRLPSTADPNAGGPCWPRQWWVFNVSLFSWFLARSFKCTRSLYIFTPLVTNHQMQIQMLVVHAGQSSGGCSTSALLLIALPRDV